MACCVRASVRLWQPAHERHKTFRQQTEHEHERQSWVCALGCLQVRYHTPARLSRKMLHHVRHGAALLFAQLGLRGAARMDGWVELLPNWQVCGFACALLLRWDGHTCVCVHGWLDGAAAQLVGVVCVCVCVCVCTSLFSWVSRWRCSVVWCVACNYVLLST